MQTSIEHSNVASVRACDRLDEWESRRLVAEIRGRALAGVMFIVVSLGGVREIHWGALCRLERAANLWRARSHTVVFETSSPTQRALLASVSGAAAVVD